MHTHTYTHTHTHTHTHTCTHTPYSFHLSRVESEPNSDFNALSDLNKILIIPNTLVFTYLPQNIQPQSQISPFSTSFGKRAVTTATVAKQITHVEPAY